jgi:clathrin heavy chain
LIPYINSAGHIADNKTLSFKLAQRFHLSGADEVFQQLFSSKIAAADYAGAATIARDAPGTLLRNQDTINIFKNLPQTGGPAPILIYFNALLQTTKLNAIESVELARPVIAQNKLNLIENWIKEGKLTMTNELGDLIRQANPQLALNIYQQSGSPDKVVEGLIQTNQLDKIMPYCEKTGHTPDFVAILRQIMPTNPQAAVGLAKMVTNRDSGPPKA